MIFKVRNNIKISECKKFSFFKNQNFKIKHTWEREEVRFPRKKEREGADIIYLITVTYKKHKYCFKNLPVGEITVDRSFCCCKISIEEAALESRIWGSCGEIFEANGGLKISKAGSTTTGGGVNLKK